MTSRALSLLASVASPVFMTAAVTGWLTGLWPANPSTLAIAAIAVVGGPLLGMVHVATADEKAPAAPAPQGIAVSAPAIVLTQKAAAARAFHNWRESVNPAIARRDRERRASRWIRSS